MQPISAISLVLALIAFSTAFIAAEGSSHGSVGSAGSLPKGSNAISSPPPAVVVSGSTSVLYLPVSLLANGKFVCTDFDLHPIGNPQDVFITSRGLGVVKFKEDPSSDKRDCNHPISGSSGLLKLEDLTKPKRVRLQIGPLNLPEPKNALTGTLFVKGRDLKPVEIPIRVEHPPSATFWTAVSWFFGVAIPAGLTALFGYGVTVLLQKATESRNKAAALRTFRQEHAPVLDTLCNTFYPVLCHESGNDDMKFARELEKEFQHRKLLEKLPADEALMLRQRFNDGDRQAIIKELVRLLPEWSRKIENPEKPES